MDKELKQKVIGRLWALCNGAEPFSYSHGDYVAGICADIEETISFSARHVIVTAVESACDTTWYVFAVSDWGHDRRTLAGFLACWLETET